MTAAAEVEPSQPELTDNQAGSEQLGPDPAGTSAAFTPADAGNKAGKSKAVRGELGGRVGYAMPAGDVVADSKLSDGIDAAVPIQLDAWLRLARGYAIGVYLGVAPSFKGPALEGCSNCSVFNARVGLQVATHLNPGGWVDPWFGIGLGYEHLSVSSRGTASAITSDGDVIELEVTSRRTYAALPEAILQAGLDFGTDNIAFGPYVSAHVAQYSEYETKVECDQLICPAGSSYSDEGNIDDDLKAPHYWVHFGLRGTYLH